MKLKIRKSTICEWLMLFLIFTYSFTKAGIHNYIYLNSIISYISFALIAVLACRVGAIPSLQRFSYLDIFLLLSCLILVLNRNNNFSHGEYEDGLSFITIAFFFVVVRSYNSWHRFIIPVMSLWVIIHTVVTILEYALPGFYMNNIFPLMPSYAEMHLRSVFKMGYMPGLAVHYSTNGMYLGVGLIVASTILFFSLGKRKKGLLVGYVILVAIALLLTGKRALVIFPVAAIIVAYYLYNSDKPIGRIGKLVLLLVVVVVAFVIGSNFIPSLSNFINRFAETSAAGDVSLGRLEQSAIALGIFKKNIIFGSGWDSFKYLYKAQFGSLLNVHNIYIQLLCENGIIGAVPFYCFFVYALSRTVNSLVYLRKNNPGENTAAELYLCFSISMQIFFLLYGMTGNPLYDQQVFYPYIVCVAAGEFYVNYVRNVKQGRLQIR
mgnify:CR=1 FL=1